MTVSSSRLGLTFVRVLLMFVRTLFILPLDVAGDGARYLRTKSGLLRNGMLLSWSLLAALMIVEAGGLKMHVLELLLLVWQCIQRICCVARHLVRWGRI